MNLEELRKLREKGKEKLRMRAEDASKKLVVGMGTSGIAAGAREVLKTLLDEVEKKKLTDVAVLQTGEKGLDSFEPVLEVIIGNGESVWYGNINSEKAREIIEKHVIGGKVVDQYVVNVRK